MKKLFTLFVIMAFAIGVFAQPPQKMSYQAVIRNSSGQLVASHAVGMRISILQGSATGTPVYVETQKPTTNANGLATVEIGGGTIVTGTFTGINWSTDTYFIKTETDLNGGTVYTITGTSQILSVPYALHAKSVASYTETDPVFGVSPAKVITSGNISNWNSAFGWGNHTGLYRANNWVPAWTDVTGKPTFATVATSGSYNDLSNKPAILTPGGATGNVQFNNTGVPGGDANFSWDNTNKRLGLGISNPYYQLHVTGSNIQAIHGETTYSDGVAISGVGNSVSSTNYGVRGISYSTNGTGVRGDALASTGTTYGIRGNVNSVDGFSGFFTGGEFYVQGNVGLGATNTGYRLFVNGEIASGSMNAFRLRGAFYSTIIRNDGADFYILVTNSADPDGNWNNFRPIQVNLGTGNLYFGSGTLCVQQGGNVGVGNSSPGYKFTVNGTAWCSAGAWTGSDIRWKKNIKDLNNSLSGILELNAVSYDLKTDEFPEMGFQTGTQIGLIAQDVEKVFPELVIADNNGYKAVSYEKLSVILVEGMKEQQQLIQEQQKQIDELNQLVKELMQK